MVNLYNDNISDIENNKIHIKLSDIFSKLIFESKKACYWQIEIILNFFI